jgi:hypothetical protein
MRVLFIMSNTFSYNCTHNDEHPSSIWIDMCIDTFFFPEYEKATSLKDIKGGDMLPASANLNLKLGSVRVRDKG